ncbi:MAG: S8 family serine peptidase [Ketobacteraceae bacterium]|nr:S8 family serine peptidase [Ketobacteraceae bacterium]
MPFRPICYTVFLLVISTLSGCKDPFHDKPGTSDRSQQDPLADVKVMFDWNQASDATICSGLEANNRLLSLGTDFIAGDTAGNRTRVDALQEIIESAFVDSARVVSRENRLSILTIELFDCNALGRIRSLPAIQFVEPKYLAPISEAEVFDEVVSMQAPPVVQPLREIKDPSINPGLYDPDTATLPYPDYVRQVNGNVADIMERHGVADIYREFTFFGVPTVGVAIIDNGVFPEWVDYVSEGNGTFEARGYYRPFSTTDLVPDGPHPQPYDLYGILASVDSMYSHGTRQLERVYNMAPHVNIISVRASPFVFWFLPTQYQGVTDSILALAEDPTVRIISSSMGTVIHVHEIERAIDYFNSFDKLFISAAGTSFAFVRDFVKIVFPASLPSTISTTGLADTQETGSRFVLGENSHGGVENDFVVDHAKSSSESVSATAGMIALLWSANPGLTREQIINVLVRNSSNYRTLGKKDPVFGWGKVNMYQAFRDIRSLTPASSPVSSPDP